MPTAFTSLRAQDARRAGNAGSVVEECQLTVKVFEPFCFQEQCFIVHHPNAWLQQESSKSVSVMNAFKAAVQMLFAAYSTLGLDSACLPSCSTLMYNAACGKVFIGSKSGFQKLHETCLYYVPVPVDQLKHELHVTCHLTVVHALNSICTKCTGEGICGNSYPGRVGPVTQLCSSWQIW